MVILNYFSNGFIHNPNEICIFGIWNKYFLTCNFIYFSIDDDEDAERKTMATVEFWLLSAYATRNFAIFVQWPITIDRTFPYFEYFEIITFRLFFEQCVCVCVCRSFLMKLYMVFWYLLLTKHRYILIYNNIITMWFIYNTNKYNINICVPLSGVLKKS